MSRFKLPSGPSNKPADLVAMRRAMLRTMFLDCQIFGHTTEAAEAIRAKIIKAKIRQAKNDR